MQSDRVSTLLFGIINKYTAWMCWRAVNAKLQYYSIIELEKRGAENGREKAISLIFVSFIIHR